MAEQTAQLELFVGRGRARRSDPVTSHQAADEVERSGRVVSQQQRVLAAVRAFPGRTSRELAAEARLDRYMVARRLRELVRAGLLPEPGAPRECALGGGPALTWRAV